MKSKVFFFLQLFCRKCDDDASYFAVSEYTVVGKYSKSLVSVICQNAIFFSKFSDTVRREVLAQYLRAKNDLNKRSIKDFKRLFVFIYYNSFFCLLLPPVNSCSISLTETGGKFTSRSIFSARQNAERAFSSSSR